MTRASAQHEEATTFEELNLVDYWLLIRKHIKGILGLSVAVALLATLIVYQVTPVYRSTSLLLIENSKSKALTLTDLFDLQNNAGQDALNSQIQILKSRAIAERVIRKLELYKSTIFNPPETTGWFVSGADLESVVSDDTLIKNLVGRFSKSLTIEPLPKSQIVKISFESSNRFLAAQVANAVADTYIENDLEARSQMTQRAKLWLTQRMEDLRNNLENSEKALQQYREKENIIDNKGVVLGGTAKQMDEISSNLIAAKQRMSEAQIVYNQVGANRGGSVEGLDSVPAITKSAAVQRAKETESNAARKLSELQSRYTAAHPKVIAAQTELHLAHEAVKREVQATVNGITKEYEIAKESVAASSRALDQIKADIQSLTRREFKLGVLMRDAESNKQLYDLFVNRAKETDVASNFDTTAGRIIDPAVPSTVPIKPKKKQTIGIAFLLGMLVGVLLVFVMDYMDNTMHSVADIERRLGIEVLGSIQKFEDAESKLPDVARAFLEDQNSPFAESVRTLRTAVLLSAIDEPHRVVMVTSSVPGEGKTTVAANLAFALGQVKKVLLIDGDIRRPSLAQAVGGLDSELGLVDYLAEEAALKDCIHATDNPHVFILPAGKRFNSPLEFLSSQRFGETIEKVKQLFDVVVIDCPPLRPVSDSLVISGYANAVLFVVKADSTPYQLASAVIKRLIKVNAPLLGVVLSQVDPKKSDLYERYSDPYEYSYKRDGKPPAKTFLGIKI